MESELNLDAVYDALSDRTRREILSLLSDGRMAAGIIAQRFGQQRPAISKHLSILKRAGLLNEDRVRQQRIYSLRPGTLMPVIRQLQDLRPPANDQDTNKPVSRQIPSFPLRPSRPARAVPRFDLEFD